MRQPAGATKAWSTIILEPTDHISRVGQDSEVTKSTRSVVVANPENYLCVLLVGVLQVLPVFELLLVSGRGRWLHWRGHEGSVG